MVTGSGRSGTGYTAALLSAAGIHCGHEALFQPRTRSVPDFGTWDGDASWLAAPFLDRLPPGTPVVHQVRDPVEVVTSWVGLRFLSTRGPYSFRRPSGPPRLVWHEVKSRVERASGRSVFVARDYERFVARHTPWVVEPRTTLDRCVRYWIAWNELVEAAATRRGLPYLRVQLEELRDRYAELLGFLGRDPATPFPGAVPETTNARPHHDLVTREQLRTAADFSRLSSLAVRYGYPEP